MGYFVRRGMELVLAALKILALKLLYGPGRMSGPPWGFGRGLNVSIRKGGRLAYGRIVARRNLNIFCDGGQVSIGDGVFFNNDCSLNAMQAITIGAGTLFGEGVKVYDHDHLIGEDGRVSKDAFATAAVAIGSQCWIGSNAVILKGVTLCDGVTIGAGAIVASSIEVPGVYVAKGCATLQKIG